ncbi:MAG TPA: MmgE/PrpD family protein [Stellaceae bacterium]|jgi:2-methylcitrate dehydratase PrpD
MDGATVTGRTDITQALAARASATTYDALPSDARLLARQCILDYYACAIAGADDPLVAILIAEMEEMGGAEIAHLIGHKGRMPVLSAALVNGAASHALDYDDVNLAMPGHPSVAVLPGLIALGEEKKSGGRDLIASFIAGYETACRTGMSVRPGHYGRGFHATGTVGAFGSAAACARLLGLDAEATGRALGIAGTQSAGLKSQFGTMCKPFHAGKAAQNGLLAARLAARGFSSRPDLIECDQGFAKTHSNVWNPEAALAEPAGGFHVYANLFKYHAACYMTHAPIECAQQITQQQVRPDDIAALTLSVNRGSSRICNIQAPADGLQAKFSLRQTVAMALSGVDTAGLDSYSVATATDTALVRLRERLELDFRDDLPEAGAELSVTLRDGKVLHTTHDAGLAMTDFAAQGARLADKFDALVEPVLGTARARELRAMIEGLDDVAEIGQLARLAAA